ncbi:MAG: DUF512 domain-containing protein [Anaerotruncus sp.]|nr:DUF512 domain-containing protein [Anaerotruncus sp.]
MAVLIQRVEQGSPAARAGVRSGDTLLSVNGHPINDVLDYRFYCTERKVALVLLRDGAPYQAEIRKGEYADLGLEFETYLMDKQHACKNKCIFCFVDQMPPGMRETLYFKDDDSRLSFLFGNYITLTNLSDADIQRIIQMHISPVNISVHTTDPQLRVQMMKNPHAAESLRYIRRLTEAGIRVNSQLVLCPGYNDGAALERTLSDLGALYPNLQSIACVPVGLTRWRKGLTPLTPYTKEQALQTIESIQHFQQRMLAQHGERVAYPSDELFLCAEQPIPDAAYYGEFDQLENGVGLIALLRQEFLDALQLDDGGDAQSDVTVITGVAAAPLLRELAGLVMARYPMVRVEVHAIANHFLGETITVAGLVTGQDIVAQMQGRRVGAQVLLPGVMLRHEQDRLLDDMTVEQLEQALGAPVLPVENDGFQLYDAMIGRLPASTQRPNL